MSNLLTTLPTQPPRLGSRSCLLFSELGTMTTGKSDLFYDPFSDRSEKPEGIDFKFSSDRQPKNGGGAIGSSGSANEEESQHEDDQVSIFNFIFNSLFFTSLFFNVAIPKRWIISIL